MNTLALAILVLLRTVPQPQQEGIVTGSILSADGSPAARIRVGAMMVSEPGAPAAGASAVAALTLTDESGRYRLEGVPPGRYYVIAGFLDSPTYYPGEIILTGARAIEVSAGAVVADINFTLKNSAGVRVSGRLVNLPSRLDPVRLRAMLTPTGPTTGSRAFAPMDIPLQADGGFEFVRVPPGSYALRVIAAPSSMLIMRPITVSTADLAGVQVAVPPLIFGRVTVDDGSRLPIQLAAAIAGVADPPAPVHVQARGITGGTTQTSMVGRDGNFVLALPAGEYRVGAAFLPIGYNVKSITYETADLRQVPLRVTGEASSSEIHVLLTTSPIDGAQPGVTLSGRVEGLPAGTDTGQIWMMLRSPTQVSSATSPAFPLQRVGETPLRPDATFDFRNVPAGSYSLQLYPPDRFRASQSVVVADQNVSITLTAYLFSSSPLTTVSTIPSVSPSPTPPLYRVQGRVIIVPGTPMPQTIRMRSMQQPPNIGRVVAIARDGTFAFTGIAPNEYDLIVVDSALPTGRNFNFSGQNQDVTGIEIKVPVEVRGRVVMADGSPARISGLQLDVSAFAGNSGTARSAQVMNRAYDVRPEGTFTIHLVQGDQTIALRNLPSNRVVTSIRYGSTSIHNAVLRIDSPVVSEIVVTVE